jgi:curved DNA-binding protein CbpA
MSSNSEPVKSGRRGMPNHYLTLDILPGASQNEIHHAYKRAKMTYSSGSLAAYSLLEDENNEQILAEVELAYEILSNPAHRREYDIKMGFNTWTEEQNAKEENRSYSRPTVSSATDSDDNPFAELSYASDSQGSEVGGHTQAGSQESKRSHVRVVKSAGDDDIRFVANPDFETKIETCEDLDGAFLRAVRIYKQVTVEQLAARSKLSPSKITAIEEEELETAYVQAVYLRGHVAILCRVLGIPNAEDLARKYADRMKDEGKIPRQSL